MEETRRGEYHRRHGVVGCRLDGRGASGRESARDGFPRESRRMRRGDAALDGRCRVEIRKVVDATEIFLFGNRFTVEQTGFLRCSRRRRSGIRPLYRRIRRCRRRRRNKGEGVLHLAYDE